MSEHPAGPFARGKVVCLSLVFSRILPCTGEDKAVGCNTLNVQLSVRLDLKTKRRGVSYFGTILWPMLYVRCCVNHDFTEGMGIMKRAPNLALLSLFSP